MPKNKIMKKILINWIAIFVLALSVCSCHIKGSGDVIKQGRTVPSFNSLRVDGSYNVHLKQDSIFKLEIEADDNFLSHIETDVSGNTLKIHNKGRRNFKHITKLDIYISAPSYEKIELRGSGGIQGVNVINSGSLECIITGSGNMDFNTQSSNLNLTITGSGNIKMIGNTEHLTTNISGSGNIEAFNLFAKTADAKVSGSGDININVQNSLNARVSGSGNITYMGNPTVDKSITGSGNISKN
jgi:hypothetical protein